MIVWGRLNLHKTDNRFWILFPVFVVAMLLLLLFRDADDDDEEEERELKSRIVS